MNNDPIIKNLDSNPQGTHIKSDSSVVISCGNASITLHNDGTVDIQGDLIRVNGRTVQLAGQLHFN
jgi:hypothetical protein